MGADHTIVSEFVATALTSVSESRPEPVVPTDWLDPAADTPIEREQDAQGVRLANPPPADVARGVPGDGQGD